MHFLFVRECPGESLALKRVVEFDVPSAEAADQVASTYPSGTLYAPRLVVFPGGTSAIQEDEIGLDLKVGGTD